MSKVMTAIDRVTSHAKRIAGGKYKVKPGQKHRMSEAMEPGDYGCQGDLKIKVMAGVPKGYTKAEKPFTQMVPGNTEGAKHCLDSLKGVTLYLPPNWPACAETDRTGPVLVLTEARTLLHPTHGAVEIPACFPAVELSYPQEWDAMQRQARRNAD